MIATNTFLSENGREKPVFGVLFELKHRERLICLLRSRKYTVIDPNEIIYIRFSIARDDFPQPSSFNDAISIATSLLVVFINEIQIFRSEMLQRIYPNSSSSINVRW